ncbi:MAG: 16S rRNA (adenine(1518)-N(6)/adenine(1519)-N(6))-dimethyltransferase RsmA [Planctomycetota bacterium]|jgi:16S rRNA (adenine1518-N6/adenine1519-N6)-dimethyltransferase
MQTKQQIRQLLLSAGISPNKRLGQHFLIDLNLMRLLVDSANIQKNDIVLEVGCGTGSMTEVLVAAAGWTVAVELDRNLAEIARKQLASARCFELVNADILQSKNRINPVVAGALARAREKYSGSVLLVANLPYNVASAAMMNLLTGPTTVGHMYVTVQKEVADRMTAHPGTGAYGILSILLGATGEVRTMRTLKPTVFWPRPRVDSAMVSFVRNQAKCDRIADMGLLSEIVHLFMGHRRKSLSACCKLAGGRLGRITDWAEIFEQCRIDPAHRPEKLGADDYVAIGECAAKFLFLC